MDSERKKMGAVNGILSWYQILDSNIDTLIKKHLFNKSKNF
jgi:hypothetical protein